MILKKIKSAELAKCPYGAAKQTNAAKAGAQLWLRANSLQLLLDYATATGFDIDANTQAAMSLLVAQVLFSNACT